MIASEIRYGMQADIRVDGDERYYVCEYRGHGENRRVRVLSTHGSYASAGREIDRLRAGLAAGVAV